MNTQDFIHLALEEDSPWGDITSNLTIPYDARSRAVIFTKQDCVVSGIGIGYMVMMTVDPSIIFVPKSSDSHRAKAGDTLIELSGSTRSILLAERLTLNLLGRLCGIATLTAEFVARANGVKILDTRKTTPLLRLPEKRAVVDGGGFNHRFGLSDGILIKDNHIAAAGSVGGAVRAAKRQSGRIPIEIEVENLVQLREAVEAGANIVMLDNFAPGDIAGAVALVDRRALIEVSGGISLKSIGQYALPGVDYISVGALTHSAPCIDVSLEMLASK